MTEERLLASDGSPLTVRRFLYHVIRLTELFTGNGTTKKNDGTRGIREYITANSALPDLLAATSTKLPVELP